MNHLEGGECNTFENNFYKTSEIVSKNSKVNFINFENNLFRKLRKVKTGKAKIETILINLINLKSTIARYHTLILKLMPGIITTRNFNLVFTELTRNLNPGLESLIEKKKI